MIRTRSRILGLVAGLALVAGFGLTANRAYASPVTLTVNNTSQLINDFNLYGTTGGTYIFKLAPGGSPYFGYGAAAVVPLNNLTSNITVQGASPATAVLDGYGDYPLFGNNDFGTLTLNNLTLQNGHSFGGGGAVINYGTLIMNNDVLTSNGTAGAGGGIYNAGTATISHTTLSNNGANGDGGAIFNDGTLTLNYDLLSGNGAGGSGGGGVANDGGGSATINSTTFDSNSISNGNGGGLVNNASTAILKNVTFTNNHRPGGSGGGLANEGGGTLTFTGGNVSGNNAINGGGVMNYDGATATISNVSIKNNSASNDGGGLYNENNATVNNSTLTGNTTSEYGGGIYNAGTLSLTQTGVNGNTSNFEGGGIFDSDGVMMTGGTVNGNSAPDDGGGLMFEGGPSSLTNVTVSGNWVSTDDNGGGGIYTQAPLTLTNTSVTNNWVGAATAAAALTCNTCYDVGGGIFIYDTTVSIKGGSVSNNVASYGGGGILNQGTLYMNNNNGTPLGSQTTLSGNAAQYEGGGIFDQGDSTLDNLNVIGNSAGYNCYAGWGAGIANDHDGSTLENSQVQFNVAYPATHLCPAGGTPKSFPVGRGGGVLVSYSNQTLNNVSFKSNQAGQGGGIYENGCGVCGFLQINGGLLYQNAAAYGGGVYLAACSDPATLQGVTVLKDAASQQGGGIWDDLTTTLNIPASPPTTINSSAPVGPNIYFNPGSLCEF